MSSSFDKAVKGACKPKAAPPKPKYLDPIIAATWSEDGAVHDVCKALTPRFREPNAIVVFKALIVLHTMIRNGATDNVLSYLCSSDILRLRNISAGHWEGYNAPQNLQNYAIYLDTRIRAYRDLKHDAIRVQSETNRDMRNSAAIEEDRLHEYDRRSRFGKRRGRDSDEGSNGLSGSGPQRSKTIAGRKLRVMTVEKGLLRETKIVQKQIDSLVETRFYLDDLEDELNITALRMLVKDLLILFQACNEGVINVLEHYFEMSKIDAREALAIYRHFCKQTERVVEYLGVAKKLQNLLNVPIPNLRHAPVSLAGSLEEYLNDPNFEQNRIEYKTNKEIADRNTKNGVKPTAKQPDSASQTKDAMPTQPAASSSSSNGPSPDSSKTPQAMIDFFTTIEEEQHSMFNPTTNSPTSNYFQQQAAANPFAQRQFGGGQPFVPPMQTGQPFGAMYNQPMQTGFVAPQQTGFNPFNQQQPMQGFGGTQVVQLQATGFLAPQMTGANPFRQSTLFPHNTGVPGPFGLPQQQQPQAQPQVPSATGVNPFPSTTGPFGQQQTGFNSFPSSNQLQQQHFGTNPFPSLGGPATGSTMSTSPFPQQNVAGPTNPFPSFSSNLSSGPTPIAPLPQSASIGSASNGPPRSASVPLNPSSSGPAPLKTHQTGSRNPFGVPVAPAPPVPKVPTLFELSMSKPTTLQQPQTSDPSLTQSKQAFTGFGAAAGTNGSVIANVASEFALPTSQSTSSAQNTTGLSGLSFSPSLQTSASPIATGSTVVSNSLFSSLSSQPTGATSVTSPAALQPQTTGFSALKPFKPSSSFGAALLESLPPIPQSAPSTPPEQFKQPSTGSLGSSSLLNTQPTGATVGIGLRPQTTGLAGAANPFRATMFSLPTGPTVNAFSGGLTSNPTGSAFGAGIGGGLGTGLGPTPTGMPCQFGQGPTSAFGGPFGASASAPSLNTQQQQQQQQQTSQPPLI
ncbi:ANTH domain-containing protein [Irpex rosettiformis]|uniref:ANTH domain-containing protein n=1 Tax=Irpex rosettiformis TaxID=378272 RepID=A0ACB8TPB4_9APHY|nr:ANTH domain-containing protein [Irpex rosettiformis]